MSPPDAGSSARMDRIYRHQRLIYDLTRKYYLLGRDRLLADLKPGTGRVLEIGCGTGRNLAVAGRLHPEARLHGVDISSAMLETARAALSRAGVAGRVRTALGDATTFDARALFGCDAFERVFFSYTLSMIPDWRDALDHAASVLAPGGQMMIVDFGQQEGLPAGFKHLLFAWLALFHVHPSADLSDALDRLGQTRGLSVRRRLLFRGYAVYATLEKGT